MPRLASLISVASKYKTICTKNKLFYSTAILLTVFSPLVTGCSTGGSQAALPSSTQSLTANNPKPIPAQTTPQASPQVPSSPQADPYPDAASKAMGAATISQTAHSSDDWKLVAQMWQEAIALMKSVPNTSSNYVSAQKKVTEYQKNLAYANKQSVKPVAQVVATVQPVVQQASFSSVGRISSPPIPTTVAATSRPSIVAPPVQPHVAVKTKQLTIEDKEHIFEASAKAFMNEYFNQTINKGLRGAVYSCAQTPELGSSLYSPESAKILQVWTTLDGSRASVTARIESSTDAGTPIRQNWKFTLVKGDTLAEKQMLDDGSKDVYEYIKSKYGGWCVKLVDED